MYRLKRQGQKMTRISRCSADAKPLVVQKLIKPLYDCSSQRRLRKYKIIWSWSRFLSLFTRLNFKLPNEGFPSDLSHQLLHPTFKFGGCPAIDLLSGFPFRNAVAPVTL